MRRHIAFVATTAVAALLLASCSSSGATKTPTATTPAATASSTAGSGTAASAPHITITNFAYSGDLSVKAGAKVTVTNNDSVAHTLTDKVNHKFDTGNIAGSGGTSTFTAPSVPGAYKFGCTYHPNMAGTLTVTG